MGEKHDRRAAVDDTGEDTFRPFTVDDRFERTVCDDHAPNQALAEALTAAIDHDDQLTKVALMASHSPAARKHKGEPRYHVRVTLESDGPAPASVGASIVGGLIDRDAATITDVDGGVVYDDPIDHEGASHYLTVILRAVSTKLEPIEVPYSDVPGDVVEAIRDPEGRVVDGEPVDGDGMPIREMPTVRDEDDPYDDLPLNRDLEFDDDGESVDKPPVEPIREWVEDNRAVFDTPGTLTEGGVDYVAEAIADTIAGNDTDAADTVTHDEVWGTIGKLRGELWNSDNVDEALRRAAIELTDDEKEWADFPEDAPGDYDVDDLEEFREAFESTTADRGSDEGDRTAIPCGCGDYKVQVPTGATPNAIDVVCPECDNHFGHGEAPDEPCPCRHDHGEDADVTQDAVITLGKSIEEYGEDDDRTHAAARALATVVYCQDVDRYVDDEPDAGPMNAYNYLWDRATAYADVDEDIDFDDFVPYSERHGDEDGGGTDTYGKSPVESAREQLEDEEDTYEMVLADLKTLHQTGVVDLGDVTIVASEGTAERLQDAEEAGVRL